MFGCSASAWGSSSIPWPNPAGRRSRRFSTVSADPRSPHVTSVRGADLAWTESGTGPPAIWAHGLTSSADAQEQFGMFDWSPISADHRLIRYDARGHGRSTGSATPEDHTWENLGRDLLGLLDAIVGDEPVAGIGSSMGTATLLHAATSAPGRFDRLLRCRRRCCRRFCVARHSPTCPTMISSPDWTCGSSSSPGPEIRHTRCPARAG